MALTYSAANSLLNVLCGKTSSSPYTQVYVGLGTTAGTPAKDGTGFVEPNGASYERQILGMTSNDYTRKMGTPTNGVVTNNNASHEHKGKIHFPELGASESWGTIAYVGLFSAKTGGTLIAYAPLNESITPTAGTNPVIPASALTLTLT